MIKQLIGSRLTYTIDRFTTHFFINWLNLFSAVYELLAFNSSLVWHSWAHLILLLGCWCVWGYFVPCSQGIYLRWNQFILVIYDHLFWLHNDSYLSFTCWSKSPYHSIACSLYILLNDCTIANKIPAIKILTLVCSLMLVGLNFIKPVTLHCLLLSVEFYQIWIFLDVLPGFIFPAWFMVL